MPTFNLYVQERSDGGVRAGLSLNEEEYWQVLEPGMNGEDSALRWYIDVRGEGDAVPEEPSELHKWLSSDDVIGTIRNAPDALAGRVAAGIDQGGWPVQQEVTPAPDGVRMRLVTSAIRRLDTLQIADIVRRFGKTLPDVLERMQPVNQLAQCSVTPWFSGATGSASAKSVQCLTSMALAKPVAPNPNS